MVRISHHLDQATVAANFWEATIVRVGQKGLLRGLVCNLGRSVLLDELGYRVKDEVVLSNSDNNFMESVKCLKPNPAKVPSSLPALPARDDR